MQMRFLIGSFNCVLLLFTALIFSLGLPQVGHANTPSDFCAISVQLVSVECLPGDPNTPDDDQFIVTTNVLGVDGADGFVSPPFYPESTPFGTNIVFGPYPMSNSPIGILASDADNPDCADLLTVLPPDNCSQEACFVELVDVEYIVGGASYLIEATVNGNGPFGWAADNGQDGNFGDRVQFGPYICGEQPNDSVRDVQEPNSCFAELTAPDNVCFCDIDLQLVATSSSADGWFASVVINGQGSSNTWEAFDGQSGFYGSLVTFGPFSCDTPGIDISVVDEAIPGCEEIIFVERPQNPCDDSGCDLEVDLLGIEWTEVGLYLTGIVTNGNQTGSWVSNTGDDGNYGTLATFGPIIECGPDFVLEVTDASDPACVDSVTIATSPVCSNCEDLNIQTDLISVDYFENGTSNTGDDFWTFTLEVNANSSGTFRAMGAGNDTGGIPYGSEVTFGPFFCGIDQFGSYEIFDEYYNACTESASVSPPAQCENSTPCSTFFLNPEYTSVGDQYFTEVTIGGYGGNNQWFSNIGQMGAYGDRVTFGPFDCSNPIDLIVYDSLGLDVCSDTLIPELPSAICQNTCQIEISDTNHVIIDGEFYLELTVIGGLSPNGWRTNTDHQGSYDEPTLIGPFSCFNSISLFVIDQDDNNCSDNIIVIPPLDACDPNCILVFNLDEYIFENDSFSVVAFIDAVNSTSWEASNGQTGPTLEEVVIGPFPCGEEVNLTFDDANGGSCSTTVTIQSPIDICGQPCDSLGLSATILNTITNDNNTPNDPSDDFWFFELLVIANNPNGGFTLSPLDIQGTYGQLLTVGPFDCPVGPYTFEIIDNSNPTCSILMVATPPFTDCGTGNCALTAQLDSTVCSDDGQFYSAYISFSGVDGDVFITQGAIFSSGEPFVVQGIPTFSSPTFTIRSLDDPFCEVDVPVQAPNCQGCTIGLELNDPEYNDNGTPNDPTDDSYTIDILVLGEQGSDSWISSSGLSGAYGDWVPFTFPCGEPAAIVEFFDAQDDNCSAMINLADFFTCPNDDACNTLTLEVELEETEECGDLPLVSINLAGADTMVFTIFDDPNGTSVYSQETFYSDTTFTLELPEGFYFFSLIGNNCILSTELWVVPQPVFPVDLIYVPSEDCSTTGTIYAPGFGNPFSCSDGVQNGNETGVDCGGFCPPCGTGDLIIDIQDGYGPVGSEVCIDLTVRNFTDVAGFQFALEFPSGLQLSSVTQNTEFIGFQAVSPNDGEIRFSWTDQLLSGLTLEDDEVLISLCFNILSDIPLDIIFSNIITIQFFGPDAELLSATLLNGTINPTDFSWTWITPNGNTVQTNTLSLPVDNLPGEYLLIMTDEETGCIDTASITLPESLFLGCVSVTGTLWADEGSCMLEGDEIPVPEWVVQLIKSDSSIITYVVTDENGNWSAELPPGDYTAIPSPYQDDLYTECIPPAGFAVDNATIQHVDVLMPYVEECNIMYTHVSMGALRVCEERDIQVYYCNDGPVVAEDAQLEVTFDDLLSVEQVSFPPAQVFNQTYVFDLGDLAPFECGTITFTVMVDCDAELGQVQCVEVIASPNAPCPTPSNAWSGATVEVAVDCDESTGVSFKIENTGLEDMTVPLEYVIIEDVIMMLGNPVVQDPLGDGEVVEIELPADGTSYVLWSNQEPGSPGAMMPIASIEGCGTDENGDFTTGVVNQFLTSPSDLDWYRLVCRPINGSFDPNAKVGYPLGYSEENLIEPGTRLTYDLYFQNTGNDFANRVVLIDTLAEEYDLGTIRLGSASHPYTYRLDTNRVLTIVFDDIMLPDSTSDPIGSQGVVQFSIDHLADLPLGTVIENEVDIYFDFNAPIRTNRTRHKLDREFLPTDVEEPLRDLPFWYVYPNPASDWLAVDFPLQHRGLNRVEAIAIDLLGREVLRRELSQGQTLNIKELPSATYLLRFQDESGHVLGKAELIKQ